MYHIRIGNTSVSVEDLGRSYPGVCQHCGKTHIRYLAHVYQDIASTVVKDKQGQIERSDEEILELGIAVLAGKRNKAIDVGCVCVAKYLLDCGVDAGLATRFQKNVTTITGYLQKCAALEGAKSPEKLAEAIQHAEIVVRLRERHRTARDAYRLTVDNPELRQEYYKVNSVVTKDFCEAVDRWRRENHGYYCGSKVPQASELVLYFDRKIAEYVNKLSWFSGEQRKVNYV